MTRSRVIFERQGSRRWPTNGLPVVALVIAALLRLPTLAMPLTEAHAFRQTQTAFTALIWRDSPIDLLHPELPVLGPPWSLPFEFPLVQALGAVLMRMGLSVEVAMRSIALVSFLATAGILWILLRRHVGRRPADIALLVFLFSPFAMEWSRASLIEYPATFFALLFVLSVLQGAGRSRRGWLLLALGSGGLVSLIKLTTAVFWLAPALLVRRWSVAVVLVVVALGGIAWTQYAESVRSANPFSDLITGPRFFDWNFGGNRLAIETWATALSPTFLLIGMLLLPFAILVRARPERRFWLWMAIAAIAPILLFTNLYAQHTYYSAAVSPAIAALVGGGLDVALARRPRTAPMFVGIALASLLVSVPSWSIAYVGADPDGVLATAADIRAITGPTDLVAIHHFDWSPAYLFYADRRGIMLGPGQSAPPGFTDVGDR